MDAIAMFRLYRYTLPYDPPFPERSGLLLFDQHTKMWGEIAPLPGRSRETLAQAQEQLVDVLNGKPSESLFPSVAFGLFCARQTPTQKTLPLSALLAGSPEQILDRARIAWAQGYTSAKVKISHLSLETAAELIQQLRTLFCLRVDANRAFSFKDAMQLCEKCGGHGWDYIEEPTYELDRLKDFSYPFALDESLLEMQELPDTPYFKAIVWKPSVMHFPNIQKKKLILSSACETGVGILGIASLAMTLPEIHPLGLDTYRFLPQDILSARLDFSTGSLSTTSMQVNTDLLQEIL
jgi:O-succinylbenzoate synthase